MCRVCSQHGWSAIGTNLSAMPSNRILRKPKLRPKRLEMSEHGTDRRVDQYADAKAWVV